MQKGFGREHSSPESKEIFANGFPWREGLCFLWYHGSWIGKSTCGETFDLTFRHNAALFPKTLSSMSLKGESCHCNITCVPPTDGVLFDLILGKASWISSYTETGFRELHDTASSHSLPTNMLRWSNILRLVPEELVNRELSINWNVYFESYKVYMVVGTIKIILELTKMVINIQSCWAFFLPYQPCFPLILFSHSYFPSSPLNSSLLSFPFQSLTGKESHIGAYKNTHI